MELYTIEGWGHDWKAWSTETIWMFFATIFLDVILLDAIPEQTVLLNGQFQTRPALTFLYVPVCLNTLATLLVVLHFVWLGRGQRAPAPDVPSDPAPSASTSE